MAAHPVDVAEQRVDLAVVREHAERLRQAPGREGVRRIALVVDREIGDEPVVEQIRIERGQLLGEEQPLVDNRAAAQRADVEIGDAFHQDRLLDAAANDVEIDLKLAVVDAAGVLHHDLLDFGPRRVGLRADHLDVHRHLAPAVDAVSEPEDFGLDDLAAALLRGDVGPRQEDHADGKPAVARLVAGAPDMFLEEFLRNLQMNSGAVAGLAVGIDRAPVP